MISEQKDRCDPMTQTIIRQNRSSPIRRLLIVCSTVCTSPTKGQITYALVGVQSMQQVNYEFSVFLLTDHSETSEPYDRDQVTLCQVLP